MLNQILKDVQPDLIYLNSLFDPKFSIPLLFHLWRNQKNFPSTICAPRGELSPGALAIKKWKKLSFIKFFSLLSLQKKLYFHATSQLEKDHIEMSFANGCTIASAGNLTKENISQKRIINAKRFKPGAPLRVIFLSRIHPKKNLEYAIERISECRAQLKLFIYGPIDDPVYWKRCQEKIDALPRTVSTASFQLWQKPTCFFCQQKEKILVMLSTRRYMLVVYR